MNHHLSVRLYSPTIFQFFLRIILHKMLKPNKGASLASFFDIKWVNNKFQFCNTVLMATAWNKTKQWAIFDWSVFGGRFSCCKQALLLLENPTVKNWDLSDPSLRAPTVVCGAEVALALSTTKLQWPLHVGSDICCGQWKKRTTYKFCSKIRFHYRAYPLANYT